MAHWILASRFRYLALLLVASVLTLAGCGHAVYPSASATASATAIATPAAIKLIWQVASSPSRASLTSSTYAVAPSDGRVTYACGFTGEKGAMRTSIWSTRDSGHSWSRSVALPYSGMISECVLIVDAADSQRVAVWLNTAKMGASPDVGNVVSFLSQDGGATWRALPKVGPRIPLNMTSQGDTLYVTGSGLSASGADLRDVWVSRDGGVTWRALGATSLSGNPLIWVNPQTGELLGTNNYDLIPTLWRSENGGATWTRISVPNLVGAGGSQTFIVAPNGAGWRICATGITAPGTNETNTLACSANLGETWTSPVALNPSQYSPKGFTYTAPSDVFAIADDGSLLAWYDDTTLGIHLVSLAPGASAWAPMSEPESASGTPGAGGTPQAAANGALTLVVYTTGPGGGILWVPTGDDAHPFATAMYL